ncbi:hypothetical protein [Streptomyces sediminimaris]|uniref:hypothetical protein n=1 Tax=Streptomyces sediminimaris TaxID=3383721 RepID=UPI00399B62CB
MTDATTGPGTGGAADRGTPPGHDRIVAPTPHEVSDPEAPAPGTRATTDFEDAGHVGDGSSARLLAHDECDKLELRLRNAVSGFVDGPREAVAEADHVVEEIAGRFTEALTRRRRTLRTSWQEDEAEQVTHPDTEQLRLALRDYRELAQRLLHG